MTTPTDFKGTIRYYNPSNHHSWLPVHARMVKGEEFEETYEGKGNHHAMCYGNGGLPVLSYDENATPEKVTCQDCLRMLETGMRYEKHENEEEEPHWI